MVDKDGVEDGDQGKNRKPHDHNRDYEGKSIYASVQAIRERLPAWSAGKLRFAMDMHCPAVRGGLQRDRLLRRRPDEKIWSEVGRFCKILEDDPDRPARLSHARTTCRSARAGTTRRTTPAASRSPTGRPSCPASRVATTIEVAYANADGKTVTDQSPRPRPRSGSNFKEVSAIRASEAGTVGHGEPPIAGTISSGTQRRASQSQRGLRFRLACSFSRWLVSRPGRRSDRLAAWRERGP